MPRHVFKTPCVKPALERANQHPEPAMGKAMAITSRVDVLNAPPRADDPKGGVRIHATTVPGDAPRAARGLVFARGVG